MWKNISFNAQNIETETAKAVLIKMPNSSNYKGYCFWHPSKLVRTLLVGNGYFKSFGYTDEFEFNLKKYDKNGKVIDEITIGSDEIEEAFGTVNDTIDGNIEASKKIDKVHISVKKPAKIENIEVEVDEDLLV